MEGGWEILSFSLLLAKHIEVKEVVHLRQCAVVTFFFYIIIMFISPYFSPLVFPHYSPPSQSYGDRVLEYVRRDKRLAKRPGINHNYNIIQKQYHKEDQRDVTAVVYEGESFLPSLSSL